MLFYASYRAIFCQKILLGLRTDKIAAHVVVMISVMGLRVIRWTRQKNQCDWHLAEGTYKLIDCYGYLFKKRRFHEMLTFKSHRLFHAPPNLTFKNSTFHQQGAFICLYVSPNKQRLFPYITLTDFYIRDGVYCAVRTGYLNTILVNRSLRNVKWSCPKLQLFLPLYNRMPAQNVSFPLPLTVILKNEFMSYY